MFIICILIFYILCSYPSLQVVNLTCISSETFGALRRQEFHPYVFQIFAQLIELRQAPLPATYMAIFPPLLTPVFWERHGNVPALVRLLRAYMAKASAEIVQQGHLQVRWRPHLVSGAWAAGPMTSGIRSTQRLELWQLCFSPTPTKAKRFGDSTCACLLC